MLDDAHDLEDELALVPATPAQLQVCAENTDSTVLDNARGRSHSRLSATTRSASAPPLSDSGNDVMTGDEVHPLCSTEEDIDDIIQEVVELDPQDFASQPTLQDTTRTAIAQPATETRYGIKNSRWADVAAAENAQPGRVTQVQHQPVGQPNTQATKPTKPIRPSPTKLAAARELVSDCLSQLQLAAQLDPSFTKLFALAEEAVNGMPATKRSETSDTLGASKNIPSTKFSYAKVAAAASNSGPPTKINTATRHHPIEQPLPRRFAVLQKRGTHMNPNPLECTNLRDRINSALGSPMIAEARISMHDNLVLFPARGSQMADVLAQYSKWRHELKNAYHEPYIPDQWVKLIAHGVPSFLEQRGPLEETFKQELSFSQIKVQGTPYWLNPTTDKQAGSVCFAVATSTEAEIAIRGLRIASVFCKVVKKAAFTNTTVCFRCEGVGHNPRTCRRQPNKVAFISTNTTSAATKMSTTRTIPNTSTSQIDNNQKQALNAPTSIPASWDSLMTDDADEVANPFTTDTPFHTATTFGSTAARPDDLW